MAFQWFVGLLGAVYTILLSPLFGTGSADSGPDARIRVEEVEQQQQQQPTGTAGGGKRPNNTRHHHQHHGRGPKLFLLSAWDMLLDVLSFWRQVCLPQLSPYLLLSDLTNC